MKIALWIVQILLALVFIASGSMKLFAFDQFASSAPALADQRGLVTFIGIAELAGALGLILPRLLGILSRSHHLGRRGTGYDHAAGHRISFIPWRSIARRGNGNPFGPRGICHLWPGLPRESRRLKKVRMDDWLAAVLCIPFLLPAFIVLLILVGRGVRRPFFKTAATSERIATVARLRTGRDCSLRLGQLMPIRFHLAHHGEVSGENDFAITGIAVWDQAGSALTA